MSQMISAWEATAAEFDSRFQQINDQWGASTPCEGWDVSALVEHAYGVQAQFGGAIGLDASAATDWPSTRSAMSAALNVDGALEGEIDHPVLGTVPKERVVAIAMADLLIHTWDLAKAIGADTTLPEQLVAPVYEGLQQLPAEIMRAPERFGEASTGAEGASLQDQMIAYAGRQP